MTIRMPRFGVFCAVVALMLSGPAQSAPDPGEAAAVFADAKAICDRDGGRFWGRSLCGPMLLVDWRDRSVIANVADLGGVLKPSGQLFIGTLPETVIIADTPTDWSGTRWTQLVMPVTHDPAKRPVTIAHELFHRIQAGLKLTRPEAGNAHLDTLNGRYLMQLEWRALAVALSASDSAARKTASQDALLFRAARYARFPTAASDEASLEVGEGIPEYTGVMLGLERPVDRIAYTVAGLSSWTLAPSMVRSFAYATGPAYGLLLDRADPTWRGRLATGKRLDELLLDAAKLAPPAIATLAARERVYDDGTLLAAERARDEGKQRELSGYRHLLVEGPVLSLPLRHGNYQFNPQMLRSLPGVGTVYPTMRLVEDWGILEVDSGGALATGAMVSVSAAGFMPGVLRGTGWSLKLNPGWQLVPGRRGGDWNIIPPAAHGG